METETAKKTGNGENLGNRRYLLLFRISSDNFAQVDYPGIAYMDPKGEFREKASGLFTTFYRIFGGGGFRMAYGFLPDFGEEVSGLFTDFYRILGKGFRIVYRILHILPDFGEEASGLFTDF